MMSTPLLLKMQGSSTTLVSKLLALTVPCPFCPSGWIGENTLGGDWSQGRLGLASEGLVLKIIGKTCIVESFFVLTSCEGSRAVSVCYRPFTSTRGSIAKQSATCVTQWIGTEWILKRLGDLRWARIGRSHHFGTWRFLFSPSLACIVPPFCQTVATASI